MKIGYYIILYKTFIVIK